MIVPFILSVSREVMATVPQRQKEAVLSLGGTRWEMIRIVIGSTASRGSSAPRCWGWGAPWGDDGGDDGHREPPEVFLSLFQQGYSMAAVIANEFAEAGGSSSPPSS